MMNMISIINLQLGNNCLFLISWGKLQKSPSFSNGLSSYSLKDRILKVYLLLITGTLTFSCMYLNCQTYLMSFMLCERIITTGTSVEERLDDRDEI